MQARNAIEFETILKDALKTSDEIVLIEAVLETYFDPSSETLGKFDFVELLLYNIKLM